MNKNILLLAANPKNTANLRLQEEEREIKERLRLNGYGKTPIFSTGATRIRDIQLAMLDFNPHVVHFCGHGTGERGLVFEDNNSREQIVTSEAIATIFKLFAQQKQLECVVLNACYSEEQAKEICKYVAYVVGMSESIADDAAIEFAIGFYTAVGAGESYEFAYEMGCNAIQLADLTESNIPILLKNPDLSIKSQIPITTAEDLKYEAELKAIELQMLKNRRSYEQEIRLLEFEQQVSDAYHQGFMSAFESEPDE
jgi:CHAT domain